MWVPINSLNRGSTVCTYMRRPSHDFLLPYVTIFLFSISNSFSFSFSLLFFFYSESYFHTETLFHILQRWSLAFVFINHNFSGTISYCAFWRPIFVVKPYTNSASQIILREANEAFRIANLRLKLKIYFYSRGLLPPQPVILLFYLLEWSSKDRYQI